MHSIIFTKLGLVTGFLIAFATPSFGAPKITQGCFMRDYSAAHLAKHPKQIVDWIRVKVYRDQFDDTVADLDVLFANQGHVAGSGFDGRIIGQPLHCWESRGEIGCSVDCDGGSFIVTKDDGAVLVFRTKGLMVGDTESCGGAVSLAEELDKPTSYRLNRVDDAACEAN